MPRSANGFISLSAIGFASLVALAGCSDNGGSDAEANMVKPYTHVAKAQPLNQLAGYQAQRHFVGSVQVKEQAQLGFELAGKVAELYVDEGEQVATGDLLARLDTRLLETEQQELVAQQQEINAEMELVASNLKRIRSLKSSGFASQQSLDELDSRRQTLVAKGARIRASLAANQLRQEKSLLKAPFDAVVNKRYIGSGEVVAAGTPALSLLLRGRAEVKVGVPVRLLAQLEDQQELTVVIADESYQVALLTKGFNVDPVTRTVQLRLLLPERAAVVNGEMAQLLVSEQVEQSGFWVPLTALTDGVRGLWNVYVLEATADSELFKLESRDVRIVYADQQRAFIEGSLQDGDRVLSMGLHRLVPGQLVRLANGVALQGAKQ